MTRTIRPLPPRQPNLPRGRFKDPSDVEDILADIGLSSSVLEEAARVGLSEYLECTLHDRPGLPSVLLSGKTARALSDLLVPQGWRHRIQLKQTSVVHPEEHVAVIVAIGDERTGLFAETPSTSAVKGLATEVLIQDTQRQLLASPSEGVRTPICCALLLHAFDSENERVLNREFSVPERMKKDGKISAWRTRLILPQIPFGHNPNPPVVMPAPAPQQPVEVQRKIA